MFTFFPGEDIFSGYPIAQKTLNYIVFYEIFDGFFHVTLKFDIIIQRLPFNLDPKYLK